MRTVEERKVLAAAQKIKARERKDRAAARPARVAPTAPGQRRPREEDRAYLSWLHQGIPCIACVIDRGRGVTMTVATGANPLEAAHQKLAIASAGWKEGGGGKRTHDARCVILCRLHHQGLPGACDNGQRNFWDRYGLGDRVGDFCAALVQAYKNGCSGAEVVQHWANIAGSNQP